MAANFEWINNDVMVTYSDTLTMDCFNVCRNEILSKPTFKDQKYQISNFLNVTAVDISDTELKMLGSMDKNATRWNNKLIMALVYKSEGKDLINLYLDFLKGTNWEVQSFNTLESAKDWLRSKGCVVNH